MFSGLDVESLTVLLGKSGRSSNLRRETYLTLAETTDSRLVDPSRDIHMDTFLVGTELKRSESPVGAFFRGRLSGREYIRMLKFVTVRMSGCTLPKISYAGVT